MASNRKQFMSIYQQTVQLLKNFKQTNDSINKSIGIEHDNKIFSKIKQQQSIHNKNIQKLQELLTKLQKTYLDPDTARKIGATKQQYKIQKDRRQNLLRSLKQSLQENQHKNKKIQNSQQYIKYTLNNKSQNNKYNSQKNSHNDSTTRPNSSTQSQYLYKQQLTQFDYEIQCKMLSEKNRALQQAQKTFLNIYNITKQTQQMVYNQGQQLDIITDQLIKTNKNTVYAVKQLKEANQQQKKSRSKLVKISILIMLAAIVAIVVCVI